MGITPLPDEQWDEMYLALGRAVSRWAHIENDLAHLYVDAVSPDMASVSRAAAFQSFWSIRGVSEKVAAVDRAITVISLSVEGIRKEWMAIKKRVEAANTERNKLAHGHVYQPYDQATRSSRIVLSAFHYEATRSKQVAEIISERGERAAAIRQAEHLLADDVESAVTTFTQLHFDMEAFRDLLGSAMQGLRPHT